MDNPSLLAWGRSRKENIFLEGAAVNTEINNLIVMCKCLSFLFRSKWFQTEKYPSDDFILANDHDLKAKFSGVTGLLKSMSVGSTELTINLDFVSYGTVSAKEKSGAYIFLPDGEAKTVFSSWSNPPITIIIGPLVSVTHCF